MQGKSPTPPSKTPGRVSLPPVVVPPKGSPFAGISGTNAPAANMKIPALTAHVALAKAQKQRLQNGGLLTPTQQKKEAAAAKVLAKTPAKNATPPAGAKRSAPESAPHPPTGLRGAPTPPLVQIGAPAAPPPARQNAAPGKPTTLPNLPVGPRAGMVIAQSKAPHGQIADLSAPNYTSLGGGESWGTAAKNAAHAIDLGLGTAAATALAGVGIGPTSVLTAKVNAPGALKTSAQAASQLSNAGLSLPRVVLVPGAGAQSTTMSPQKLVAAGLTAAQTKHYRDMAINQRHWDPGEVNDLVGLDLIKHAYNDAPSGIVGNIVRTAQNFGSGVIRTGALPNVGVAIGHEIATGHGMRAAKEIGNAFSSQIGGAISNPGQAFRDDPYTFLPIAGGGLKTLGGIGGKLAEQAGKQAVERSVTHAVTGHEIPRGTLDRNLYVAAGQKLNDFATSHSPHLSDRAGAQAIDKLVGDVNDASAPLHHPVQVDFANTFKKVGPKRAAILMSINKAGGKPEKILAYYEHSGNKRQVKHWTEVVAAHKNLTESDHAFMDAHRAMAGVEQAGGTTATNMTLGRFGDAAATYRAHQPLILSDAHLGDPGAQRVQALHDEWINTLKKTDDPAVLEPLHGAYEHAVQEFAQTHLDTGGTLPTRVQYTKPPDTGVTQPLYRSGTGGRARFNSRIPKQKPSTGASFESGDYLIDPKAAIRENLQAQRLRTSIGLTAPENLAKIPGAYRVEKGAERKPGFVFTPEQNQATIGKVITDLHDAPVGAHDYYHRESDIRDRYAKHLEANADRTGEYAATSGWMIPEGSFNRILDYTRPESRHKYDQFMRQYQRVMISLFPSTLLGNTVGSVPLALAAGAGPKSLAKAFEAARDPSIAPHSLHGKGVAGNLAADMRPIPGTSIPNPATWYMGKMRAGSVKGEDFSRNAAYFAHVLKGADKRSKELGYDHVNDYLRDVAVGKVDPQAREGGINLAVKFAGDAAKPATKAGRVAGRLILFPQWLQHMTKLMLVTLPLHHPRRMVLINALAQYGDTYRKEHGVLPSWMQEFAPLFNHTEAGSTFTRAVGLGQLAPQGTAGGIFDTISQSGPITARIAGLANPPIAVALNTAIQEIKNQGSHYPVNMGRFALNQALGAIPGERKVFPQSGMEGDSLPWDPRPFVYTNGTRKSAWNPDNSLPANQRPGNRPLGGIEGFLSRAFGRPMYDVPSGGKINKATVDKAIAKAQPKTKAWG